MKQKIIITYIILFLFLQSMMSFSQGFLHTSGTKIVDENNNEVILRGIGLGGWMLQEGYMMHSVDVANTQHEFKHKLVQLIGESATDSFYVAWRANHITRTDIDSLATWGFNSVRLPMHYNLFTLPVEEEPDVNKNTFLPEGFELVDSLLSWCSDNHIWLILDLHATPGGQGHDEAISDYDPSKPSLWESPENRAKTIALWHKLAERYKDEPWIGGYDLINETNWDLGDNSSLKKLYLDITNSIRSVDKKHIIFIEGNWFANDFSGLTPPWDNNMVYSFHKYWNYNDIASIEWMLNIRTKHNVPIWLGESGENSNSWFMNCIRLMEENNIGWAWWPMKKLESINCIYSARESPGYQKILDYWAGNGIRPSVQEATDGMMELARNMLSENCDYHPDFVDALLRQPHDQNSRPFTELHMPGTIYTTDYDIGVNGVAYFDQDIADYHSTSEDFTAWNNGWVYRNDGVDIQKSDDDILTNGYNIAWIETNEWMTYTVNVDSSAAYVFKLRTASQSNTGRVRFLIDDVSVTSSLSVPNSGGWQKWTDLITDTILLSKGKHKLTLFADHKGFNAGGFASLITGTAESLNFKFVYAETNKFGTEIILTLNMPVSSYDQEVLTDMDITVNNSSVHIDSIRVNDENNCMISVFLTKPIKAGDRITASCSGSTIVADNQRHLNAFQQKPVKNNVVRIFNIPGNIQAEDFFFARGIKTENTTDTGGGLNIGWTDVGDYMDYYVRVSATGGYKITFRTAAQDKSSAISLFLFSSNDTVKVLTQTLPITSGWQNWESVDANINLTAGDYILRLVVEDAGFNLNWINFALASGINKYEDNSEIFKVYLNPSDGDIHIAVQKPIQTVSVYSLDGKKIIDLNVRNSRKITINTDGYPLGCYLLLVKTGTGEAFVKKIFIQH